MRALVLALRGASAIAIAASVTPTPSFAQSEPAVSESDEILVQARRRGESLQDVPLVVQAVTEEELNKYEFRRFEDITRLVPGLQLDANPTSPGTFASLRGVNFDSQASGASTTIEFYRNDAVITSSALFQAVYDIGQIEVLRGPQGTLRGRASPSGSITVTTRRPELGKDSLGVTAQASYDSSFRRNVNGAVNVPVIPDVLGVRVAGFLGQNRGNDVTGVNIRTGAADKNIYDKTDAWRGSIRFVPIKDVLVLDYNHEHINRRSRGWDQVESFNLVNAAAAASPRLITPEQRLGILPVARKTDSRFNIDNWQAQLKYFGQQLTYVGEKVSQDYDQDSPQDFAGLFPSDIPVATPTAPYNQNTATLVRQSVHEVRLQNDDRLFNLFDYTIGYMTTKADSPTFLNNITAFASSTTLFAVSNLGLNRYRNDSESSYFGNLAVHLFDDRLEVGGGIRKIRFKANSGVQTGTFGAPISTYVESIPSRRCFGNPAIPGCLPAKKATIYNATAKFKITDDILVYGTYGTSWRPGNSVIGFRGLEVGTFLDQFLNLPDETSKSFEVGFKTQFFDDKLTFNISAYRQKYDNYAFRLSSPVIALSKTTDPALDPAQALAAGFNFVAPVDPTIKGIEAELSYAASKNLNFGAVLAYADGKITNGIFPCLDLNNDNIPDTTTPTAAQLYAQVGNRQVDTCVSNASPSNQAPLSGSVFGEYSRPVFGHEGFLRGFANWKGKNQGFTLNPYDQVSAYALIDVFTGIRSSNGVWEATFFVKNILGTDRVLTRGDSPLVSALRPGTNLAAFGGSGTSINSSGATNYLQITTTPPREFGVNLKVNFSGL